MKFDPFITFIFCLLVCIMIFCSYRTISSAHQVVPITHPAKMYKLSSNEYYGTFLISSNARKFILHGDKHTYAFYGDNCLLNGRVAGRMYVAWGGEEDMRIDLGQRNVLDQQNIHVSRNHVPEFKTMMIKCTFPFSVSNDHSITLSGLPDGFDNNMKRPLPSVEIITSIINPPEENVPGILNCGRQLFGYVDGDILVRHVENGLENGIEHFVFFDMGNANISMTDRLKNHLSSGTVSIIDMKSELSYIHGESKRKGVVMDTKAGAQWLTRYECMNRFYYSKWIGFLDYDEFLKHPVVLNEKYPVAHFEGTHGDPREYCGAKNVSQKYLNKYSGISPSKYFIQPRLVNPLRMRIHVYPGMKKHSTENHFVHHRCINSIIESEQIH